MSVLTKQMSPKPDFSTFNRKVEIQVFEWNKYLKKVNKCLPQEIIQTHAKHLDENFMKLQLLTQVFL